MLLCIKQERDKTVTPAYHYLQRGNIYMYLWKLHDLRNLGTHWALPLPISSHCTTLIADSKFAGLAQVSSIKDKAQPFLTANADPAVVLLAVSASTFSFHFQKLIFQLPAKKKIKAINLQLISECYSDKIFGDQSICPYIQIRSWKTCSIYKLYFWHIYDKNKSVFQPLRWAVKKKVCSLVVDQYTWLQAAEQFWTTVKLPSPVCYQ